MINKMDYSIRPRRMTFNQEKLVFYMDFNSGYKPIIKYLSNVGIIDNTSGNYKKDPNGYGNMLEFDGVLERIRIPDNIYMHVAPNQKFTLFCRFKILTIGNGDFIFGRTDPNLFFSNVLLMSSTLIRVIMSDDTEIIRFFQIPIDLNWHEVKWGFDGVDQFAEFDGVRQTGFNFHNGFTDTRDWGIGADFDGQNSSNVQISEVGMIVGASL
jgi:hypothetical protein